MFSSCGQVFQSVSTFLDEVVERSLVQVLIFSFAFASVWSKLVFDSYLTVAVIAVEALGIQSTFLYSEVTEAEFKIFDVVFFAPLVETLIFQGIVQNLVSRCFEFRVSLIVNILLFSMLHLVNDLSSFIGAIGSGVMLFLVYEHFRRKGKKVVGLVWVTLLHAFWNTSLLYSVL